MDKRTSGKFNTSAINAFTRIPKRPCKILTVDRGKEFTLYAELTTALSLKIYFCDPCSPWQRGINENTNGLLRQLFPKKTSFALISHEDLERVICQINNRAQKRLGCKTPAKVFLKKLRR